MIITTGRMRSGKIELDDDTTRGHKGYGVRQ